MIWLIEELHENAFILGNTKKAKYLSRLMLRNLHKNLQKRNRILVIIVQIIFKINSLKLFHRIIFHYYNMISFLIVLFLAVATQAVPINRNIQNLQAGTFAFSNSVNSQSQLYMWQFQKSFDVVPQLGFAINSFSLANVTLVGSFNILTQIISEVGVIISWKRQIARWSSLTITYLATTRKDILLGYSQLSFKTNNSQDFDINLNAKISLFSTSIVRVYLAGCDAQAVFECGISGKKMTETVLTVSAYLPTGTTTGNLSFNYIIFSPSSASFSSYGGMLDKTGFKGTLSLDIRRVLYRTAYMLYGYSMLNFSLLASQNINLAIDSDMVLTLNSANTVDSLRMIYIGIGLTSKELCNTPAYGYQWNDQCVASCPNDTYVMNYSNGGFSCNVCSKKLSLVLTGKGCVCSDGLTMINGSCVNSTETSTNTTKQVITGGGLQSFLDLFRQMQQNITNKVDSTSTQKSSSSSTGSGTQQTSNSSSISTNSLTTTIASSTKSTSQTATISTTNGSVIATSSTPICTCTTSSTSDNKTTASSNTATDTLNSSAKTTTNDGNSKNSDQNKTNSTSASTLNFNTISTTIVITDQNPPINNITQNKDISAQLIPVVYQSQAKSIPSQSTKSQYATYQQLPLIGTSTSTFSNTSSLCPQNAYLMNGRCFCMPGFRNISGKCTTPTVQSQVLTMVVDISEKKLCPQSHEQQQSDSGSQNLQRKKHDYDQNSCQMGSSSCLGKFSRNYNNSNQTYEQNSCNQSYYGCESSENSTSSITQQPQCPKGSVYFANKCIKCPSPATFDYTNGQCNYFCGQFATYNETLQRCQCLIGYGIGKDGICGYCSDGTFLFNGYCVLCADGKVYDFASNSCKCGPGTVLTVNGCVSKCGQFQNYDQATDSCVCERGLGRIQGKCQLCPSNQRVDSNGICSPCPAGQQLLKGKCFCPSGFVLKDNVCLTCDQSQKVSINGICASCAVGFNYASGSCQPSATINSVTGRKAGLDNSVSLEKGSVCGNGIIEGLEQCDDHGTISGDGCDSQCRIQAGYTCSRMPSQCVKTSNTKKNTSDSQQSNNPRNASVQVETKAPPKTTTTANVSTSQAASVSNLAPKPTQAGLNLQGNPSGNSNQIYLTLNTGVAFDFPDQATMQSFIKAKFQGCKAPTFYFSQRPKPEKNLFDCLLIFPSGIPNTKFTPTFLYSYNGSSAELPISIDPFALNSLTNSRSNSRQQSSIRG